MKFIVQFDNSLSHEERLAILKGFGGEYLGNIFAGFELVNCNENVADELLQHESVLSVEVDGQAEPSDIEPTGDFPTQFINVLGNAHDKRYKGNGIVVAIIDSGINSNHEDLQFELFKCARISGSTIVSVDRLADVQDFGGHGTAVAAVIAMQDNGKGYVGVAPQAKMMIIKGTISNTDHSMHYSTMAKSIIWAVDNGANVINISFSQGAFNQSVQDACEYAYKKNVSVVATAGNDAADPYIGVAYWKDYTGVLTISSVKLADNYNGRHFPELPTEYSYRMIYYTPSLNRYRIAMSDHPITIEKPKEEDDEYLLVLKSYCETRDLIPPSNTWVVSNARRSEAHFNFKKGEPYPEVVYCNHKIINNKDGGIVQYNETPIELFMERYSAQVQGEIFDKFDPKNIIRSGFSSYGSGIDFSAPGHAMLPKLGTNDEYRLWTGTSFAAPYVAGMIAIIRQRFSSITVDEIYGFLKTYALTVGMGSGTRNSFGNGLATIPDLSKDYVQKFYHEGRTIKLKEFTAFSLKPGPRIQCKSFNLTD